MEEQIIVGKSKAPKKPSLKTAKKKVWKIPEQLESGITKAIREILKTVGLRHWKQLGTLGSEPGLPDIIGLKKVKVADLVAAGVEDVGVFFGIEVKRPKGVLSEKQEKWKHRILESGGIFVEARSVDDAIEGLNLRKYFLF